MRYVMKQKILAWGDDFTISDEHGRAAYHVDGKVFSFDDKLSIQDAGGNEVAYIDQRMLSIGPTYEIYRDGRHADAATIAGLPPCPPAEAGSP